MSAKTIAAALLATLLVTWTSTADVAIQVTPSIAPNAFGSPSWPTYRDNAVYAIEHGLSSYGNPSLPSFYQVAPSQLSPLDNIVTGFPSWHGDANPGATFGPAFANEYGNRLHFGIHVLGNGQKFSISELSFTATSSDPGNTLGFTFATGSYNYSPDYVGINYVDGIKGNGNDVIITSGLNTQLVDELVGRGSGNAWAVYDTSDPAGGTRQDKINYEASLHGGSFMFTGTYSLTNDRTTFASGQAEVAVTEAPLPSTVAGGLVLVGVAGAFAVSRRAPRAAA